MGQLFHYAKRAANTIRAFRAFGLIAVTRKLECGSGMNVKIVGPAKIDIGNRVIFGHRCGVAVEGPSKIDIGNGVTFGSNCGMAVVTIAGRRPAELMIGTGTSFQNNLSLNCFTKVEIGSYCAISWDVHIMDTDFHKIIYEVGTEPISSSPVCIGDRVWIGARSTILKGVTIGSYSMVAAGSVVTKSYPTHSLIGGSSARRIKAIHGWRP